MEVAAQLFLFISTPEPDPVSFTVSASGYHHSGVATDSTSYKVGIPNSLQITSSAQREKGIYIKAQDDKRIIVYGLSYHQYTSDAFLALPCRDMFMEQYEYFVISYEVFESRYPSLVLIVACQDDTVVDIGNTLITLYQHQTYQLESSQDLTGTRITATKPISVFSGQDCAYVPRSIGACDHLIEQIPPTASWGTKFLVASLLGRNSGERVRILSADASTVVVNCSTPQILSLSNAGDWTEITILPNSFCSIVATSPIFVAQYSYGISGDGQTGDPFMMMISPIEQYYVIEVLPEFSTNYVTIFVEFEFYRPQSIFIDSSTLSQWTAVYCSSSHLCGYVARTSVSSGEHHIYHQDSHATIGISVYGFNRFNSYGYPGGLRLSFPLKGEFV